MVKSIRRSALGATGVFFVACENLPGIRSSRSVDGSDGQPGPDLVLVVKRAMNLSAVLYEGAFPSILASRLYGIELI